MVTQVVVPAAAGSTICTEKKEGSQPGWIDSWCLPCDSIAEIGILFISKKDGSLDLFISKKDGSLEPSGHTDPRSTNINQGIDRTHDHIAQAPCFSPRHDSETGLGKLQIMIIVPQGPWVKGRLNQAKGRRHAEH